ncbi:glycosyltransferase [bacterium 210820-DFI.6.37]|nr:glycosyltransferase [bacterium 210820-DFI.6.37]
MNERILLIHPSLGIGGAEKIIAFLANELSTIYNVTILTLKGTQQTLDVSENIPIECRPCYSEKPIFGKNMLSGLRDLKRMSNEISQVIEETTPKLVICFDLRILLAINIQKIPTGTKILFSERADPFENPFYWAYLLKKFYKRIDYIVFQTNEARAFYGDIVSNKSAVIANPALLRVLEGVVRDESESLPVLFAAGRFQHRKGFDILINAFAQIADDFPDYIVKLYGNGEEIDMLMKLIRYHHMEERIHILEPINGVVEKNINATLFVIPSRSEGIPNILIEAMVAGIPSVATDCSPGGAKMLSGNGEYCLLAENDDVDSLRDKLSFALSHPNDMKKYALKAKQSLDRFDKDKIFTEWKNVIAHLIG